MRRRLGGVCLAVAIAATLCALLARGLSPYNEALAMQYCVPRCFQSGAPAPVFRKGGTGAGLALTFEALEDLSAANAQERFGYILAAHLAAL